VIVRLVPARCVHPAQRLGVYGANRTNNYFGLGIGAHVGEPTRAT
jgi:hypothetical protein